MILQHDIATPVNNYEYISNFKEGQKTIYYLSGDNVDKLLASPQIEGFLNKGIDVLLFTDPVDNFWVYYDF